MARSPKETGEMVNMPKLDSGGGSGISPAGSSKQESGKGLEQIDGAGTQRGAHPAKVQPKIMRYI